MGDWLEEIAGEFPDAFFEELDGGIQLEEEALPDPEDVYKRQPGVPLSHMVSQVSPIIHK